MEIIDRVDLAHVAMKLTLAEWSRHPSHESIEDTFVRIYRTVCWAVEDSVGDEPENATVAQG